MRTILQRVCPLLRNAAIAAALWLSTAPAEGSDFKNGGFETYSTSAPNSPSQPFPFWELEYSQYLGGFPNPAFTGWSPTLPAATNHPAPAWVTSVDFSNTGCTNVHINVPCGSHMVRINDLVGGLHATRISQETILDPNDIDACGVAVVQVHWIAVLDNPTNHSVAEQPFFIIDLEKAPNGSTQYQFLYNFQAVSSSPNSGFSDAPDCNTNDDHRVRYRDYTTPFIVLGAVPGDRLRLTMTASDCSLGAHGGMAFLDCVQVVPGGTYPLRPALTWTPSSSGIAGDFNGDGKSDLALYDVYSGMIRVLISNGSSFLVKYWTSGIGAPTSIYAGDFDGKGNSDLILQNGTGSAATFSVLYANAAGTGFTTLLPQSLSVSGGTGGGVRLWVGDFNDDGRTDVARVMPNGDVQVAQFPSNGALSLTFSNWGTVGSAPPSSATYDLLVGDFDGDNKDDLAVADTSVKVLLSTGSGFGTAAKWLSEKRPFEGWNVGYFDCDSKADLLRKNGTTGALEVFYSSGSAAKGGFLSPPKAVAASTFYNSANLFSVGDYDGDGRDDLAQEVSGVGTQVLTTCSNGCSCMSVLAGQPVCDPNDSTKYQVPITITNHTGVSLTTVYIAALSAFGVSPGNVVLNPPLLNRKSRTVTVTVTGVTEGESYCLGVSAQTCPDPNCLCGEQVCFTPPHCDCMQITDDYMQCATDGSGAVKYCFTIKNLSGITANRLVLSPGANFPQSPITVSLNSGQSLQICTPVVVAPGTGTLHFTVKLSSVVGNQVFDICSLDENHDVLSCPGVLGWCCVPNTGCQNLTSADCSALGGQFSSSPATCQGCQIAHYPTIGSGTTASPAGSAYLTLDGPMELLLYNLLGTGEDGCDFLFAAATNLALNWETIDPATPPGAFVSLTARGTLNGQPNSQLGALSLTRSGNAYQSQSDFSGLAATAYYAVVYNDDGPQVIQIAGGPTATINAWPSGVRVLRSDMPSGTHGFALSFDSLTTIQVAGDPTLRSGYELQLLAHALAPGDYFTGTSLRASGIPLINVQSLSVERTPCPGDLNGDRKVDLGDLAMLLSDYGVNGEGDVTGDARTDLSDVAALLSHYGATCP